MRNYLLHVNGKIFYIENDNGQIIVPMVEKNIKSVLIKIKA